MGTVCGPLKKNVGPVGCGVVTVGGAREAATPPNATGDRVTGAVCVDVANTVSITRGSGCWTTGCTAVLSGLAALVGGTTFRCGCIGGCFFAGTPAAGDGGVAIGGGTRTALVARIGGFVLAGGVAALRLGTGAGGCTSREVRPLDLEDTRSER